MFLLQQVSWFLNARPTSPARRGKYCNIVPLADRIGWFRSPRRATGICRAAGPTLGGQAPALERRLHPEQGGRRRDPQGPNPSTGFGSGGRSALGPVVSQRISTPWDRCFSGRCSLTNKSRKINETGDGGGVVSSADAPCLRIRPAPSSAKTFQRSSPEDRGTPAFRNCCRNGLSLTGPSSPWFMMPAGALVCGVAPVGGRGGPGQKV